MDIFTEYEKEFAELVKNYEKTKYFRERLCPDQYVGKIEQPEHWNNFKREPIFGDEWNVQNVPMEENIMIMILRTSGKYKAAGFVISGFSKLPSSPTCVEDSAVGFPSSQEGTYCEKLFNGTVKDPTNTFRQYELPF